MRFFGCGLHWATTLLALWACALLRVFSDLRAPLGYLVQPKKSQASTRPDSSFRTAFQGTWLPALPGSSHSLETRLKSPVVEVKDHHAEEAPCRCRDSVHGSGWVLGGRRRRPFCAIPNYGWDKSGCHRWSRLCGFSPERRRWVRPLLRELRVRSLLRAVVGAPSVVQPFQLRPWLCRCWTELDRLPDGLSSSSHRTHRPGGHTSLLTRVLADAGLRSALEVSRWKVTGCDAGTEVECTGLRSQPRRQPRAGAYGRQARADPCRPQRIRWRLVSGQRRCTNVSRLEARSSTFGLPSCVGPAEGQSNGREVRAL